MRRKVILRKNSIVVIFRNYWGGVYRFRLLEKHLKTQAQYPSLKKNDGGKGKREKERENNKIDQEIFGDIRDLKRIYSVNYGLRYFLKS